MPEEDSHRTPKQLIIQASKPRLISKTINSTIASHGKGGMQMDADRSSRNWLGKAEVVSSILTGSTIFEC